MRNTVGAIALIFLLGAMILEPVAVRADANSGSLSGVVTDTAGNAVGGATVSLSGPASASTMTDKVGTFLFSALPVGTYRVSVSKAGYADASRNDILIAGPNTAISVLLVSTSVRQLGRIVVLARASTINKTPAAVTQTTIQGFQDQNLTHLQDVLEQLPSVSIAREYGTSSGLAGNDFYSPISDTAYVSIRGAFSYESAVYFDDHPLNGGNYNAGFNVGPLTTLALQRVDLIRGPGAMSPSVNGAIGGSVNYVSIEPHGKPTINYSVGTDGFGGSSTNLNFAGQLNDRVSLQLGYLANNTPGVLKNVQEYSQAFAQGFEFWNGVPLTTPTTCPPQGCYYGFVPGPANGVYGYSFNATLLFCCIQDASYQDEFSQAVKVGYQVAPKTNVTVLFGGYQYKVDNGLGGGAPPFLTQFLPLAGYTGSLPSGALVGSNFAGRTTELEHQSIYEFNINQSLGKLNLRLSYLEDTNNDNIPFGGTQPLHLVAYGTGWLNGSNTPTNFNGESGVLSYCTSICSGFEQLTDVRLRDVIGELNYPVSDASTVTVAYDKNVNKSFIGFSFPPIPAKDHGSGHYGASIYSLMIRDVSRLTPQLEAVGSMYFNSYDDHISTVSPNWFAQTPADFANFVNHFVDDIHYFDAPRFGLTWTPNRNTAVRFGAGSAIAPVPLGNLAYGYGSPPMPNSFSNPTYYTQTLPSTGLREETAFGFSTGADFRIPGFGMLTSIDLYRTNLWDQFLTTTIIGGALNGRPLYTTQQKNLSTTREEGIEFGISRYVPRGIGFNLQGALQRAYIPSIPPNFYRDPVTGNPFAQNLSIIAGHNFCSGYYNGGAGGGTECIPYSNGSAQISYGFSGGGLLQFTGTYYGPNNGYYRPAFMRVDAGLRVPVTSYASLQFNVHNLNNIWGYALPFAFFRSASPFSTPAGTPIALAGDTLGISPGGVMGPRYATIELTGKI